MRKPKITRRDRLTNEVALYLRQVGRKAPKGGMDPNDRTLDHELELRLKRMSPLDFNDLTRADDE